LDKRRSQGANCFRERERLSLNSNERHDHPKGGTMHFTYHMKVKPNDRKFEVAPRENVISGQHVTEP